MKRTFSVLLLLLAAGFAVAQTAQQPPRIVFQMMTGDTLAHKALMRQLGNITSLQPDVRIEVVCHGPGLDMVHQQHSVVADRIKQFHARGVQFSACEFSMKERKVSKEQILSDVGFVPSAILHIAKRQDEGWSYIKSGF
ncbi:MAG: DsrE family protein [Chitinophagales bacterium]|nr:DsrE family protein [Chitinophagales bacterium]MDW8393826.1 DsrE family protein [Chitinophagales bacterium]